MTSKREEVYQALFGLVSPLVNASAQQRQATPFNLTSAKATPAQPFRTITRKIIETQRIDPLNQPVLMQYEYNEENVFSGAALVHKLWTVIFIFGVTHDAQTPGASLLNPLIDAVEAALQPTLGEEEQTLGGLVTRVTVKGTAAKDHGDNSTKADQRQSSYYLPVEIILPVAPTTA